MALFPHLLQPALWERTGNIPPLVRLLQAFLEKGGTTIASTAADKIVSAGCSGLFLTEFTVFVSACHKITFLFLSLPDFISIL